MRVIIKVIQASLVFMGCISYMVNAVITTIPVTQISLEQSIVLDARIEAINKTTLAAQTSGQITAIYFDAGEIVTAGSVLLKLKDENQQANYKAAQASLKATKAELTDASKSLKRIKKIFAKKLASQQTLDNAKARFNIAKANKEGAIAQLNSAKEQLNYTVIKAPYGGIVLDRHVNLGEIVSPGTPLFTGTSLSQLRVVSQIPQRDIEQVKHFSKASIELPQGEIFVQEQKALKFYAYANPQSATFKVRIALPKNNHNLYPGMYLKTHFKTGTRQALVVSNSAIVKRSELRAVYVLDKQGKLHLRQVRTGEQINDGSTEILAGLSEGEQIVVEPLKAIRALQNLAGNKREAK